MGKDIGETDKASIRVLLAGEGPTDQGVVDWDSHSRKHVIREGPCQPLVRKCAKLMELEISIAQKSRIRDYLTYMGERKLPKNKEVPGHGMKAWICLNIAFDDECQAAVVMVDGDKQGESPKDDLHVRKRFVEVHDQLETGFRHAKKITGAGIECICMVPMRMIESWLMADPEAFERATGVSRSEVVRIKKPESLWGKDEDPSSDYPKNVMNRLLAGSGFSANRETFNLIAEEMDLAVLKKRCPVSAVPFIEEAQNAFDRIARPA